MTLPPLNAVRVFECVARHGSFAKAAGELFVTQSAVSKQIASLEDFVGSRLFERHRSGVTLTLEGQELKNALIPAFDTMRASFERYSRRPPRSSAFKLTTVASFASEFLVPRLERFEARFPDLELELSTTDRLLDFDREEVDLSIRCGTGDGQGLTVHALGPAELVPVCTPEIAERTHHDAILSTHRRIQVAAHDEWRPLPDDAGASLVVEHFVVAIKAVLSGVGVALLPELLVRDHLARSELVGFGERVPWDHPFHLAYRADRTGHPDLIEVAEWFIAEAA